MKPFFIDQSGKLGGAELCLADIALAFKPDLLIGLLQDGPFRELLNSQQLPVQVLTSQTLRVRKESGILAGLRSLRQIIPLTQRSAQIASAYELIYANTPKALVIAAFASALSQKPLVYHLHDIISLEHFSATNRRLLIFLANHFASLVIANSEASKVAFIAAGGKADAVHVVYNGFRPEAYCVEPDTCSQLRQSLGLEGKFVVGHFSRLSPWKGQDVLIKALTHCPDNVVALLVGDALFGEDDYVNSLKDQIASLNLQHRVHFLGFRSDVPELMHACDLITHTSTAPEPFGRVIVEAMLCRRPVIAAAAGGAKELVQHGQTGWLSSTGDAQELAALVSHCSQFPEEAAAIGEAAYAYACQTFKLETTNQQIVELIQALLD